MEKDIGILMKPIFEDGGKMLFKSHHLPWIMPRASLLAMILKIVLISAEALQTWEWGSIYFSDGNFGKIEFLKFKLFLFFFFFKDRHGTIHCSIEKWFLKSRVGKHTEMKQVFYPTSAFIDLVSCNFAKSFISFNRFSLVWIP